jgi:5-methylcytosine-specific restriction endonuclease McrA
MKLCVECFRPFTPDPSRRRNNRCDAHQAELTKREDARRNQRAKAHGRTSAHWKRLRLEVLERDDHTCQRCGAPAVSVHIRPELAGDHRAATTDDCWSMCASCHGTIDAPRAMGGGRRENPSR